MINYINSKNSINFLTNHLLTRSTGCFFSVIFLKKGKSTSFVFLNRMEVV